MINQLLVKTGELTPPIIVVVDCGLWITFHQHARPEFGKRGIHDPMADASEMQDAVGSLKQFNAAARKELKALQKQLKKIKKSSASKEANKVELLLRRRETIEKLRISNQEHEMLSAKVKRLRKELRNENHAKLVLSCQNMVVQYVKEIKREMNEGVGPGASTSKYHTSNTDRNIPLMDEKDTAFHAQELQLKLGDVMMDGSTSGYDKGEQRHSLESHQRGTELTGLEANTATTVETKADTPDGGGGGGGGGDGGGGGRPRRVVATFEAKLMRTRPQPRRPAPRL